MLHLRPPPGMLRTGRSPIHSSAQANEPPCADRGTKQAAQESRIQKATRLTSGSDQRGGSTSARHAFLFRRRPAASAIFPGRHPVYCSKFRTKKQGLFRPERLSIRRTSKRPAPVEIPSPMRGQNARDAQRTSGRLHAAGNASFPLPAAADGSAAKEVDNHVRQMNRA